jgi:glutamyl endopeptidase
VFAQREAYRVDRERESVRVSRQRESAPARAPTNAARTESAALMHQPDSNRAPMTESREYAPTFGTKGRGVAMTMERMSVPTQERPETVAAPGTVTARPIDAYWASYGTAVERAVVRSQADQQTKVMLESIIGTDDRTKVTAVDQYPWRCICSLLITAQNGTQYLGTGWLVAPRLVLTAGHCVYMADEGGWAAQIEVTPGRNGADRANGSATSRDLRSVTGWTQDNNSDCDYGAILLPADKRFGDTLGWFGYAVRDDDYLGQVTLNLSGYPGDGGPTHEDFTQWYMSRAVKDVMARQITYEIDTYGGQSGSPVWEMTADGSRYGVGIHTFGTSVSNGATRIVREVFDNIVLWAGEGS